MTISIITPIRATRSEHIQWLGEAVGSVLEQSYSDWEMIIVDDHSSISLPCFADKRICIIQADGTGVSAARNQAARIAQGEFLLPLDSDDKLSPDALEKFLQGWEEREGARIIYSDTMRFGQDYAKLYIAPEYDFGLLLEKIFMTVGCLHLKEDWERAGGWSEEMEEGLEIWEYWIRLGEQGVCGKHIPYTLYWYRRAPGSRLTSIKSDPNRYKRAYNKMRDLHRETYNGRWPVGCCGGSRRTQIATSNKGIAINQIANVQGNRVAVVYAGNRLGDFWLTGRATGIRYHVSGQLAVLTDANGVAGVDERDVNGILAYNAGKDFRIVSQPTQNPAPVIQDEIPVGMLETHPGTEEIAKAEERIAERGRGRKRKKKESDEDL